MLKLPELQFRELVPNGGARDRADIVPQDESCGADLTRRGEPPGPSPVVEAAPPRPYDPKTLDQLIDSGAPPHIVYAYCATGLLVTDESVSQLSAADPLPVTRMP